MYSGDLKLNIMYAILGVGVYSLQLVFVRHKLLDRAPEGGFSPFSGADKPPNKYILHDYIHIQSIRFFYF